jgi:protein-disulfide isomerase-like protein with CxxC motif
VERRVGDTEPLPPGWRRTAWQHQRRIQAASGRHGDNAYGRAETRDEAERLARAARDACPIERAKLALRRRGFSVFAAATLPGGGTGWMVGGRRMTDAELLAAAAKHERKEA